MASRCIAGIFVLLCVAFIFQISGYKHRKQPRKNGVRGCEDRYPDICERHRQKGECKNPSRMIKMYCKKSCNTCSESSERYGYASSGNYRSGSSDMYGSSGSYRSGSLGTGSLGSGLSGNHMVAGCRDNYPTRCAEHRRNGDCSNPSHNVKRYCKKSCNLCQPEASRGNEMGIELDTTELENEKYRPQSRVNSEERLDTYHAYSSSRRYRTEMGMEPADGGSECIDRHPKRCKEHKRNGHCANPSTILKTYCRKSCDLCVPDNNVNNAPETHPITREAMKQVVDMNERGDVYEEGDASEEDGGNEEDEGNENGDEEGMDTDDDGEVSDDEGQGKSIGEWWSESPDEE